MNRVDVTMETSNPIKPDARPTGESSNSDDHAGVDPNVDALKRMADGEVVNSTDDQPRQRRSATGRAHATIDLAVKRHM